MEIVMVCTGNTCRSPMAEAIMRNRLAEAGIEGVAVRSAGLCAHPDAPMTANAMAELERRGVGFYRTRATRLTREMVEGALVLTMTAWHAKDVARLFADVNVSTLNEAAGLTGDIDDPFGGGEYAYRRAADQIDRAIQLIVDKIAMGNHRT